MEQGDMADILKKVDTFRHLSNLFPADDTQQTAPDPIAMMDMIEKFRKISHAFGMNMAPPTPKKESAAQASAPQTDLLVASKEGGSKEDISNEGGSNENNFNQNNFNENNANKSSLFGSSKKSEIVNAALPFLDRDLQKIVFVALRLMEIKKAMQTVPLIAQSRPDTEPIQQRREMLHRIRPHLNDGEKKEVDLFMKAMEMRQIMLNKKGGIDL